MLDTYQPSFRLFIPTRNVVFISNAYFDTCKPLRGTAPSYSHNTIGFLKPNFFTLHYGLFCDILIIIFDQLLDMQRLWARVSRCQSGKDTAIGLLSWFWRYIPEDLGSQGKSGIEWALTRTEHHRAPRFGFGFLVKVNLVGKYLVSG